jgi:hypothetical protein
MAGKSYGNQGTDRLGLTQNLIDHRLGETQPTHAGDTAQRLAAAAHWARPWERRNAYLPLFDNDPFARIITQQAGKDACAPSSQHTACHHNLALLSFILI